MDTEEQFDNEFDVDAITRAIVDKSKLEGKSKYGNKKKYIR